jgi:transcriptional regulator with XRE-family HTH domain
MPLKSEDLSTQLRQEFCRALKAARERSGITLAQIAEQTKIPACMFEALERSDLRRWPKALFRRSFFRDYVRVIGLPVAETSAEFVRLFPDDEGAPLPDVVAPAADEGGDVRLTFDAAWHGPGGALLSRLFAAAIDASVVLGAAALAWLAGVDWRVTAAIVALAYFSLATAVFGESPAKWAIARRESIRAAIARGLAAIPSAFGTTDSSPPESTDEPEIDTWITDARRVGPSRLRVRIKVPQ